MTIEENPLEIPPETGPRMTDSHVGARLTFKNGESYLFQMAKKRIVFNGEEGEEDLVEEEWDPENVFVPCMFGIGDDKYDLLGKNISRREFDEFANKAEKAHVYPYWVDYGERYVKTTKMVNHFIRRANDVAVSILFPY